MKKVLVLEDEPNIRSFVVINLKRSGYEPIEAENGMMALEKLKVNPDKMSVESGRQLLDEYFRRVNAHLATFGQVKALRRFGIPVPMTFDEANRTLTRLFKDN